jgi:hypothetical protein
MDFVVILDGAIQAAGIASPLALRDQFDLPLDNLGLQLREGRFAVRQAQAQRLDARSRIQFQREQRLRIRIDLSFTDRQTELYAHRQNLQASRDDILCRRGRRLWPRHDVSGCPPHQIERCLTPL